MLESPMLAGGVLAETLPRQCLRPFLPDRGVVSALLVHYSDDRLRCSQGYIRGR